MSEAALMLEAFHVIRPLWLVLLLPVVALWWSVRRGARSGGLEASGIAPHLRRALTVGGAGRSVLQPVDGVALVLALALLGAAGPTWSRQLDPFAAQSAPAVVILAVTSSMEEKDLPPSRLERGKQKIRDFLDLRAGARTALVAYSGTAHVVLPMTEDPQVMVPYLAGLSTEVMPREGNAAPDALALAQVLLGAEDAPGGVLLVTDAIEPADAPGIDAAGVPLAVLAMRPEGSRDRGLGALSAPVVQATADAADIRRIDGLLNAAYRRAQLDNVDLPWQDRGHWLAWPAAFLLLLWFRRGWTMRWAVVAALALTLPAPEGARADGLADWFLTPDQQGRLAYDRRDFGAAAERFADPLWRGYALYRHGQYEEAVEVLGRVETAQAAFIQGMAQIKSRAYRDGVRSFETALARDPDYPGAAENLAQARAIVDYVEEAREEQDTGEDSGIGADEVVFDNEAARGEDTQMEAPENSDASGLLSVDQWMRTVDTRTGDFLRLRFALEAAGDAPPLTQEESDRSPEPAQ